MLWKKPAVFDLTPLTSHTLIVALGSFIVTFFILSRWQPKYAGRLLACITVLLSLVFIEKLSLKIGLVVATVLIIAVGQADETKPLSAAVQLFWQLGIAIILATSGWIIPHVTNPIGSGVWHLGALAVPATIVWIMLMLNAINWLDGLDGLASSVSLVAFLTLAAVSLLPATQDTTTLNLSLIAAGALLGFFLYNAPPAKVYLGTVGSWFVGLFLALTALIGGGKVATATLVLAIPILDAGFVILQRLLHRQPPWIGDKSHLHHRLLAAGFSSRQIIILAATFTATLGGIAVTAQTIYKLWALLAVVLFLAATILTLSYLTYARSTSHR